MEDIQGHLKAMETVLRAAHVRGVPYGILDLEHMATVVAEASARIETLERLDREAGTYVESVICMRTDFTGDPPYVGWKGLGLALNEAMDELDRLRAKEEAEDRLHA